MLELSCASGGSASTINISTLPNYRSGEGSEGSMRRQARPRASERIPEGGSPYMDMAGGFTQDPQVTAF